MNPVLLFFDYILQLFSDLFFIIISLLVPKTDKTASVLNEIKTNNVKKERYLIRHLVGPKTSKTASNLN